MRPKKSLGQHFLTSSKIVDDIVVAAEITKKDTVLEIGPGRGVLTQALLLTGARVIAVEKDDALIPELSEKFSEEIASGALTLVHGDILETDISRLISGDYRLVANIPYYITGQIMRMFLETEHQPKSMTVLVQKEVAERIVARDGKESVLSLSVKVYGTPKLIRTVAAGSFNPPPAVDSAVLHISGISKNTFAVTHASERDFFTVLKSGFAHKRKQLIPNLSSRYPRTHLTEIFSSISLDPRSRAEDVSLKQWLFIAEALNNRSNPQ